MSKKVVFINPLMHRQPAWLPLGIGYVASVLRNMGCEIEVIDINGNQYSQSEIIEKIDNIEADIVGFGGLSSQYKAVKEMAIRIKGKNPYVKLWAGRMVATASPRVLLENTPIEVAIIDEAERTIVELINAVEKDNDYSDIKGIWWKKNGEVIKNPERPRMDGDELDKLPFPAWDLLPVEKYLPNIMHWNPFFPNIEKGRSINISTTRGCPYDCKFCSRGFGRLTKRRSPQSVVEEIIELKNRYDVKYIGFGDDLFTVDKKWVMSFCDELIREDTDIHWGCAARVNTIDRDILEKMRKAGCVWLGFGLESGSQKMLDVMGKNATVEQAKKALKLTQEVGIFPNGSFIIGTPGESYDSIRETIEFIKDTKIYFESFFFLTPYPATPFYDDALIKGLIGDEESYMLRLGEMQTSLLINMTDIPNDSLSKLKETAEKEIKKNIPIKLKALNQYAKFMLFKEYVMNQGVTKTFKILHNKYKSRTLNK